VPLTTPLALSPATARKREDLDDGTASVATAVPLVRAPKAPHRSSSAPPQKSISSKPSKAAPAPTAASRDPLAPRLRPNGAPLERQALEREHKRSKVRLLELEKRITESEQAVKALEQRMAEPGFYDDRERAAQAAEEHQNLMWETGALMSQWEALQAEVDEKAQQLAAVTPPSRR
jgi:hypothetical protein